MLEPDFSGWASKNDMECLDGKTIKHGAFKHQDKQKVPLVWQHQHGSAENILGHAILEDRAFGVYTQGFFNATPAGQHAKEMVIHGDVEALSIWANELTLRGKDVLHGQIREVSLVMAGANPGALIENVYLKHGADGEYESVDGEAIIYSGIELDAFKLAHSEELTEGAEVADDTKTQEEQKPEEKSAEQEQKPEETNYEDMYDGLDADTKNLVNFLVGAAVEKIKQDSAAEKDQAVKDAVAEVKHSGKTDEEFLAHIDATMAEGIKEMTRNVFEQNGIATAEKPVLEHSAIQEIFADAKKNGSFKDAVISHAATYGIEDIDLLFPDAKSISNSPEIIGRRTEWVDGVITGTKHVPFTRIKSTAADLTADEARAKGYVKGNLKKEEVIKLLKRITSPTTIYKKQKLDRDDILDITDFEIVGWLKAEMRLMLDEEIARAVLIGDGREADDDDKIDEDHIRPIAFDDDMYAHKVTIQSNASGNDIVEAILRSRTYYKGTGTPTLFTTDALLTDLILLKDKVGRRLYTNEADLAAALRVTKIVTVEVMEDEAEIIAILVNLADYTIGADKGGNVTMFEDFDIDYNQQKYLIETRISGALTKPKSALVIRRDAGTVVTPSSPSFDGETNTITIPTVAGVVYRIDGSIATGAVVIDETTEVEAFPATGYTFPANTTANWTFVYTP